MGSQQHLFGPTPDAEQSQWFTPDWLAERVVRWAGVQPGQRIVELGAGDGAFVRPLLAAGAEVIAVERDPRFVDALARGCLDLDAILCADALTYPFGSIRFDACIGNPPYEDDADIAFVERGLELAPRVIAVLRLVFLAGKERHRRIWSKHSLRRIAYLPERPRFIGEKSGSALADFAVFDIRRGLVNPLAEHHEWWTR